MRVFPRANALVVLIGGLVAMGLFSQSADGGEPEVRIWDGAEHYQGMWDAWPNCRKNRAAWEQVPYGKTDYRFKGDTVLENRFF